MSTKADSNVKRILKLNKIRKSGAKSLNKAVINVKEIVKIEVKNDKIDVSNNDELSRKKNLINTKSVKRSVNKKSVVVKKSETTTERGVIYIGHIPHGFYEVQMKKYFSQFGKVTNIRVCRSKKTGRSKGFGFIEFLHPEVAKVAAESMNNYLMFNRLIKAQYIPPDKQHDQYFKGRAWSAKMNPKLQTRLKIIKSINNSVPNKNHELFVKKSIGNLSKLSKKLKAAKINLNIKLGDVQI